MVEKSETADAVEVEPGLVAHDSGGQPVLVGARCKSCGTIAVGLRPVCPGCWAEGSMVPHALSRRGRIASSFVARTAPPGFTAPYRMAFVELPEGLRVIMRVDAAPDAPLVPGTTVELGIGTLGATDKGAPLTGPIFRLVEGSAP